MTTAFEEQAVDEVMKRISKEDPLKILDVAAGNGALSLYTTKKIPTASVLATDFSEGMVTLIKNECNRMHLSNIEAQQMNGMVR